MKEKSSAKSLKFIDRILYFLNPVRRLGYAHYSFVFPLIASVAITLLSEYIAFGILHNPNAVGNYIIFVNVFTILYFSFRDGMIGGFITTVITLLYYLYIIYSRHFSGSALYSALEATFFLVLLYFILAAIIGFLKQRIDSLIIQEKDARVNAEEGQLRIRTILQQLPVGVLIVSADGKKIEGNKHLEKMVGRKVGPTIHVEEFTPSNGYKDGKRLLVKEWPVIRSLQHGVVVASEEIEYTRDDKKRVTLRVNASPIKSINNKIIAAVSTFYDITQEKELEKRKDDFVNMASHELKTPITSMKLYIDLLLTMIKKHKDEKALKTIQSIKAQTERLQELVNDLLDVSRIQTGKLHFQKEQVRLDLIIKETVDLLQQTTKGQHIILKSKTPVNVYADRFRIYQVITNLITNAIKYSPENSEIIITVVKEKNKAVVSVRDFGIGISKEQQKKIFDRLYQVTDPHEKTFPGLGMGLYISKEIVKRHKGSIWVTSEGKDQVGDKRGSTFHFSLPLE